MQLKTNVGRLRFIALLEGISLLMLIFITVPMKYIWGNPIGSEIIGPIHGMLFVVYVILTFSVAGDHKWKFFKTTLLVLAASFIPFGTFYIDSKILKPLDTKA